MTPVRGLRVGRLGLSASINASFTGQRGQVILDETIVAVHERFPIFR